MDCSAHRRRKQKPLLVREFCLERQRCQEPKHAIKRTIRVSEREREREEGEGESFKYNLGENSLLYSEGIKFRYI